MGRRSDHTKEELQQLIINAALDLVKEQGVSQVTVRQIAKAVGYTPGMLYSVFDNLQAIFLHVNVQSLDRLFAQCDRARKKAKDPEGAIRSMAMAYLKFAQSNTHQFQLLFQATPEDVVRPLELGVRIRSLFELVEDELDKLNPSVGAEKVEIGARTLWSGVHGAAGLRMTNQLYSEKKNADRLVVEMLVSQFVDSWKRL